MLDILGRFNGSFGRTRVSPTKKRCGQAYFRPALETLENRTLLSLTVFPALGGAAFAGLASNFNGFQYTNTLQQNQSASFQGLGATASTEGTASLQTTDSSIVMQATIQSTENYDQTYTYNGTVFAETTFLFIVGFVLSDPSVVTWSGNFQLAQVAPPPPPYTVLEIGAHGDLASSTLVNNFFGSLMSNPNGQTKTTQVTLAGVSDFEV